MKITGKQTCIALASVGLAVLAMISTVDFAWQVGKDIALASDARLENQENQPGHP